MISNTNIQKLPYTHVNPLISSEFSNAVSDVTPTASSGQVNLPKNQNDAVIEAKAIVQKAGGYQYLNTEQAQRVHELEAIFMNNGYLSVEYSATVVKSPYQKDSALYNALLDQANGEALVCYLKYWKANNQEDAVTQDEELMRAIAERASGDDLLNMNVEFEVNTPLYNAFAERATGNALLEYAKAHGMPAEDSPLYNAFVKRATGQEIFQYCYHFELQLIEGTSIYNAFAERADAENLSDYSALLNKAPFVEGSPLYNAFAERATGAHIVYYAQRWKDQLPDHKLNVDSILYKKFEERGTALDFQEYLDNFPGTSYPKGSIPYQRLQSNDVDYDKFKKKYTVRI